MNHSVVICDDAMILHEYLAPAASSLMPYKNGVSMTWFVSQPSACHHLFEYLQRLPLYRHGA